MYFSQKKVKNGIIQHIMSEFEKPLMPWEGTDDFRSITERDRTSSKESNVHESKFSTLFKTLKSTRSTEEEIVAARNEIDLMVSDAEHAGLYDYARQKTHQIVANSEMRDAETNLNTAAEQIENETDYTDFPDMKGLVRESVKGAANSYGYLYLSNLSDTERADIGVSDSILKRKEDRIRLEAFWDPGIRTESFGKALRSRVEVKESPAAALAGIEERPVEEQLRISRLLLDRIESNDMRLKDGSNLDTVQAFQTAIRERRLDERVAEEATARYRLKETVALNRIAGANSEKGIEVFQLAVQEAERNGHLLTEEDLNVLLTRETLNGLPVGAAIDKLQQAAFEPVDTPIGRRIIGESLSIDTRQRLENHLIYELAREQHIPVQQARTTYELVDTTLSAIWEKQIWMDKNLYDNPLAQTVYLYEWRRMQEDKGPAITAVSIDGFGTSFPRQAVYNYQRIVDGREVNAKSPLINRDHWIAALSRTERLLQAQGERTMEVKVTEEEVSRFIARYLIYHKRVNIDNPKDASWFRQVQRDRKSQEIIRDGRFSQTEQQFKLNYRGVDFTKLGPKSFFLYESSYLPKIFLVQRLMLTRNWDMKELNPDNVEKWYGAFKKADPFGNFNLRYWFTLGLVDDLITHGGLTTLSNAELEKKVFPVLIEPHTDPETGKGYQFISDDELDVVRNVLETGKRGSMNALELQLAGYVQTARR